MDVLTNWTSYLYGIFLHVLVLGGSVYYYYKKQPTKHIENEKKIKKKQKIGVVGMEVYFPRTFVEQTDLEENMKVSTGKFTKGLGQLKMGFVDHEVEDINSITLTVVKNLLEKYQISPHEVGRIEIGTETLIDKSKSTKTVLMQLFSPNSGIEGVTNVNACYGGTAALFNCCDWIESSAWDGRYAIVVAADIAVYKQGPARPTGGCGAMAMLLGPNGVLLMENNLRSTFAANEWDFYKPDPHSEYPTVNGANSQQCYLNALDHCYQQFCRKKELSNNAGEHFSLLKSEDFVAFHSPYNKLVQKSFARLLWNDLKRNPSGIVEKFPELNPFVQLTNDESLVSRELDLVLRKLCAPYYAKQVEPGTFLSRNLGNAYTASVFMNLAQLLENIPESKRKKNIVLFSYGSGCMASMYSFSVNPDIVKQKKILNLNLAKRLEDRICCSAEYFQTIMKDREVKYSKNKMGGLNQLSNKNVNSAKLHLLFPGTFYLEEITATGQRKYNRFSRVSNPCKTATLTKWQSSTPTNQIVVCGSSAFLPRLHDKVNSSEFFNGDDLLSGRNCISMVKKDSILKLLGKVPENGEIGLYLVNHFNLPMKIVETMDLSVQLAVDAGLEELCDSGMISTSNLKLPPELRESTAIIFATSFPGFEGFAEEIQKKNSNDQYLFNRKFLFKVLCLANSQLAQIIGAKGPNIQTNAACAGMTQALDLASDWLKLGKCQQVLVVASDTASSENLRNWIGSGFSALGAASVATQVEQAAIPFDTRRQGMILSAGAAAIVLQRQQEFTESTLPSMVNNAACPVYLLLTHVCNSAYHGSSLDAADVAAQMDEFLSQIEEQYNLTRRDIAQHGVYFSHETMTNPKGQPEKSCAFAEINMLRHCFGDSLLADLLICNTKQQTGHPMSVSFEDVCAILSLQQQIFPPINIQQLDPVLAKSLNFANEKTSKKKYAIRFAAGFGSQLAFSFYSL